MEIKQEIVKLTKKLISFKTITGESKEVKKAFLFLQEYLKPSGLDMKNFKNGPYGSYVVTNQKQRINDFDLLLHGHILMSFLDLKTSLNQKLKTNDYMVEER